MAGETEWADALRHARTSRRDALATCRCWRAADLPAALTAAARLFDAGLFFEGTKCSSHTGWPRGMRVARRSRDDPDRGRLAAPRNGNVIGARSLLADGAARCPAAGCSAGDFDQFAQASLDAVARVPDAVPPPFPASHCKIRPKGRGGAPKWPLTPPDNRLPGRNAWTSRIKGKWRW